MLSENLGISSFFPIYRHVGKKMAASTFFRREKCLKREKCAGSHYFSIGVAFFMFPEGFVSHFCCAVLWIVHFLLTPFLA
jgi:hypothetical protein